MSRATVIATVSLIVAVASAGFTGWEAKTANDQLAEDKREFSRSGPIFDVSDELFLWNTRTRRWSDTSKNSTVSYAHSISPWEPALNLKVTNSGRSIGTVNEVGLSGGSSNIAAEDPLCAAGSSDGYDCSMPVSIKPGETESIWFYLSPAMIQSLTCNDKAAKTGVVGYLRNGDGKIQLAPTTTALPISGYCQTLPSTPPGG